MIEFDGEDDVADDIAELSDEALERDLTFAAGHASRDERNRAQLVERERRSSEAGDE